ncbi:MAG: DUF1697 domain-containing protein [Planctomycetaceae bacterium]|nr:DUF1697 domain-containing protein [Planctomycetaceae bacterium]
MPEFAALLRGVSPLNAKMPELKKAFERGGFRDVRTVLGSGNVVFSCASSSTSAIEKRVETALQAQLGRCFLTIVRPIDALRRLLASQPYRAQRLGPGSKRVVTFLLRKPVPSPRLPIELDGARILLVRGTEAFSVYLPCPRGPVFMALIEKTFGKDITTRTWETIEKVTKA